MTSLDPQNDNFRPLELNLIHKMIAVESQNDVFTPKNDDVGRPIERNNIFSENLTT